MTKKSNLSLRFTRVWEKHCLKTVVATLLLWCAQSAQATTDTYKTQATASIQQQTVKATGVIIDNTGEPLIGVSVKVQGTNTGTITDLDGKFSIDTPKGAILEFSFIGYKTVTTEVTGKELHITMQEDSKQLDEVVVCFMRLLDLISKSLLTPLIYVGHSATETGDVTFYLFDCCCTLFVFKLHIQNNG
jgi:hypothetical protein